MLADKDRPGQTEPRYWLVTTDRASHVGIPRVRQIWLAHALS